MRCSFSPARYAAADPDFAPCTWLLLQTDSTLSIATTGFEDQGQDVPWCLFRRGPAPAVRPGFGADLSNLSPSPCAQAGKSTSFNLQQEGIA
jgi:hypothetical protein